MENCDFRFGIMQLKLSIRAVVTLILYQNSGAQRGGRWA